MNLIPVAHAGVITNAPSLSHVGLSALYFLLSVFTVVAIIMLGVSGMMYFFAAGDQERMRTAKLSAKYSVIGIIVTLGSMVVVTMIGQFFQ